MNSPEEAMIEILSWLPAKSLLRFRCVSKTWLRWISFDSRFIKLHLDRSKHKNPGIIVSRRDDIQRTQFYCAEDCTSSDDPIHFEIPFNNPHYGTCGGAGISDDFRVVNVCNGLICLTDFYDAIDSNVYVWNPLTRDHIIIPVPSFPSHFCTEGEDRPDLSTDTIYGFGFHQGSNEYKVLRFVSIGVYDVQEFTSDVCVYTLGTDSWRSLGDIMDYNINLSNYSTALVNESLHWFAPKARPDVVFDVLVSFDLQAEFFREIPQPKYIRTDDGASTDCDYVEGYITYFVGELSGLLCIFRIIPSTKTEIWIMKEYGVVDSWVKQFNVKESEIPLGVVNNKEILLMDDEDDCHLILYNHKTNSSSCFNSFSFKVFDRNIYSGSLLSPTMINRSKHSST